LDHSSFGTRKEKKEKGKQGSRKEEWDQETSAGILVGNIFHV